ncbi:MAG: hypothetical protein K8F54_06465 [Altibacter sp.]|uniref:hypothetical protein n=1 Tax=Altibacter sp. TaxID=2024823 RepID=UPI001D41A1AD|nr:hypothetical protein [Altibacter sp.]MBZ0327232.1 hypothetical protein [Altibacter sp.]
MKTRRRTYFTTLIVLLISGCIFGQTYTIGNSANGIDNAQSKAAKLSFLSSQVISPNNSNNVSASNSVYILQVGNNNNVVSNTRSNYSDVNLFQRGNNNEVLLDVTALIIDENVLQLGNNNRFIDLSLKGTVLHNAAVLQKGQNQNLIWYGSNSISERMMVTMKGKNQTILIRNIKR